MKELTKKGTRKRFVELMENINKIKIDESIFDKTTIKYILGNSFNMLINNELNVKERTTNVKGDETFIELKCSDKKNNEYIFTIKAQIDERGLDDVFNVSNAELYYFSYDSVEKKDSFEIDEVGLKEFNEENSSAIINVVTDFADVEKEAPMDTIYDESVKKIDMLINENVVSDLGKKQYNELTSENKNFYIKQAKKILDDYLNSNNITIPDLEYKKAIKIIATKVFEQTISKLNEDDYPEPMGKDFKTKSLYPKKKTQRKKKVQIKERMTDTPSRDDYLPIKAVVDDNGDVNESTKDEKYERVIFLQGDEADEALKILDEEGQDAALEYLKQWHDPGNHMGSDELGHGTRDRTYEKDGYHMSWNSYLNYIGLEYELSHLNETNKNKLEDILLGYHSPNDEVKDTVENFDDYEPHKISENVFDFDDENVTLDKSVVVDIISRFCKNQPSFLRDVEKEIEDSLGVKEFKDFDDFKSTLNKLSTSELEDILTNFIDKPMNEMHQGNYTKDVVHKMHQGKFDGDLIDEEETDFDNYKPHNVAENMNKEKK